MKKHISLIFVLALWLSLTAYAWVKPADASSDAERRALAQFPELTVETLLSGRFMTDFADYAVDQFPLRQGFRSLNALLTRYGLGQKDSNGYYVQDGYIAKMEYPLNEDSLSYAAARFRDLYELYLTDSEVYFAMVPDKGYYLAEDAGVLSLNYETLFSYFGAELPWAEFVDIRDCLSIDSYYRTDTHWRQEALLPVAEKLGQVLGVEIGSDYDTVTAKSDFYGVYYGQAALPMEAEELNWLTWKGWEDCTVYSHDTGSETLIYDESKLFSRDPYESYLSGNMAIQVIESPDAASDRELIVFRDSFGSSLVPLLVRSYAKITLIDTRYVSPSMVGEYVDFEDAQVLMLYSTLVLNSSSALRK